MAASVSEAHPDAPPRAHHVVPAAAPRPGAEPALPHHGVPPSQWQQLAGHLARWTGLAFPSSRLSQFARGVAAASESAGAQSVAQYVAQLTAAKPEAETIALLAQHLTVGETYFFRDPPAIHALANHVLPRLQATTPRALRLWSAGCCTGEEVYTLAILLQRARLSGSTVLGTDINPAFLARARLGVYGDWSFRGDPFALRRRWLSRVTGGWAVSDALRTCVRFEADNLAGEGVSRADTEPPQDLIVCRNVLMYLSPEALARTVARFRRRLVPGGWLLVSPGEASDTLYPGFEAEVIDGVRFYRRCADAAPNALAMQPVAGNAPVRSLVEAPAQAWPHAPAHAVAALATGAAIRPVTGPWAEPVADLAAATATHKPSEALPAAVGPDPSADHRVLARALADQGYWTQALQSCEAWVTAEPLSAVAPYVQALVLIEQADSLRASEALRRALYLDDRFIMAWLALARLARTEGDELAARRHLGTVRRLLDGLQADARVPEADGLAASQVAELVTALQNAAPQHPETAR